VVKWLARRSTVEVTRVRFRRQSLWRWQWLIEQILKRQNKTMTFLSLMKERVTRRSHMRAWAYSMLLCFFVIHLAFCRYLWNFQTLWRILHLKFGHYDTFLIHRSKKVCGVDPPPWTKSTQRLVLTGMCRADFGPGRDAHRGLSIGNTTHSRATRGWKDRAKSWTNDGLTVQNGAEIVRW